MNYSSVYRNPVYHQVVFGTLIVVQALQPRNILKNYPAARHLSPKVRSEVADLFLAGLGTFIFGFLIWNLDNIFCTDITRYKTAIGWPAAFLLEGEPFG